jgi:nucleotidyltransferase/DNA polymerase involved in DNA repair
VLPLTGWPRPLLQKSKKVFAVAARFVKCIEKASIDEVRCPASTLVG